MVKLLPPRLEKDWKRGHISFRPPARSALILSSRRRSVRPPESRCPVRRVGRDVPAADGMAGLLSAAGGGGRAGRAECGGRLAGAVNPVIRQKGLAEPLGRGGAAAGGLSLNL